MMKKIIFPVLVTVLLASCKSASPTGNTTSIYQTNYHGWSGSFVLRNGKVEAVVVPAIGRVMQFRFAGETEGPFWENKAFEGRSPNPTSSEWGNYGGDKTWPAPQGEWQKITKRGWPPPQAFDSMAVSASEQKGALVLESPVDPHFGIKTIRTIQLAKSSSQMTIVTEYVKVSGEPSKVAIWTITQLKDPLKVSIPVSPLNGLVFNNQSQKMPADWNVGKNEMTFTRGKSDPSKVGAYGDFLRWTDGKTNLQIDSPRQNGGDYTDAGSSIEVYTSPDPLPYVELELLNPMHTYSIGDHYSKTNVYTLSR
ncbi:MAG: hypothetical protein JWN25_1504 [Verrucomicrobiales bacterium]|nr:hypothetical protein [Verrucomicrobiales bacterium]